ncbi:hypothetical protein [Demequina aurantiaca]|uniref:hypothetical protein n=1 Tax=Demequina aurantiaca TaxID=676200 RepID=UPI003D3376EA
MQRLENLRAWIYAWYVVVALLIGAWAGNTFRGFNYDGYEVSTYNWEAFAVGALVAAALTLPLPLFAVAIDRRREERNLQRELDAARHDALAAKMDAVMAAIGAKVLDAEAQPGGEVTPSGEGASSCSDSDEALEFASIEVGPQARSPYEPPPGR